MAAALRGAHGVRCPHGEWARRPAPVAGPRQQPRFKPKVALSAARPVEGGLVMRRELRQAEEDARRAVEELNPPLLTEFDQLAVASDATGDCRSALAGEAAAGSNSNRPASRNGTPTGDNGGSSSSSSSFDASTSSLDEHHQQRGRSSTPSSAAATAAVAGVGCADRPAEASSSGGSGSAADHTAGVPTTSSSPVPGGATSPSSSNGSSQGADSPDGAEASARVLASASASTSGRESPAGVVHGALYPPSERSQIQDSWDALMRWSKFFRRQQEGAEAGPSEAEKVVVFGGGSFGTAMGTSLARKRPEVDVVLLLRDPGLCTDINTRHCNTKYLPDFKLPPNMRATTDIGEAADASYAVHAVPVQHSRAFLEGIRDVLPAHVPIVCVSKGLEVGTGCMMSEVIPSALGRRQPATFISGPSFAREVMEGRPTGVVAASRDAKLARQVQQLFASPSMRVNTSTDVIGVEICGALKNVLAIAAGIVEGLDLGHNALAALVAQGCAEIRWLAEKLGAKPQTMSGLSGLGDIMLTCYGDLSRNRSVGMRLGRGERLEDILASSTQVAEGVATAGVVVSLARRYRVSLPVLTAVAQVLDNNLTPAQAVAEIMSLPQVEEH